ncbi:MAG: hypothetical protein HC929_24520 [Leptolyngbyaceae cyanobacterium SM2_5_2]|nr:hypothetical protein [Leptolyngbyaceae cyanobacterium SM2_5_2]
MKLDNSTTFDFIRQAVPNQARKHCKRKLQNPGQEKIMADLTDLIDQNIEKMRELSTEGDRALEEITELGELLNTLAESLSCCASKLHPGHFPYF